MLSFNRYGAKWSGSHSNTNINVLRNEWGFDGFTLTDNDSQKPYMAVTIALPGGTNGYDCWSSFRADQLKEYRNNAEIDEPDARIRTPHPVRHCRFCRNERHL